MQTPVKRAAAAMLALAIIAGACGSDDPDEATTAATEAMSEMADDAMDAMDGMDHGDMEDDAMDDMDGMDQGDMAMNMGDASATRADEVADADLVQGEFTLLDSRSAGHDDTTGTAWMARHDGTTVTIELAGLVPDTEYIAHLHESDCADSGGDHYRFDKDGSEMPPNEIHLLFTADADGNGFMTAENDAVTGDDAVAIVVHPTDLLENKIACAEFG